MKEITRIVNVYLFVNGNKKCYFHIVKQDKNSPIPREYRPTNGTSECWVTGWNPMPVSGIFYSSLHVFQKWMEDNDWSYYVQPITTIIEKEEVNRNTTRRV